MLWSACCFLRSSGTLSTDDSTGSTGIAGKVLWESLIDLIEETLHNQDKDPFGTRVEVSGFLDDVDTDVLTAIAIVLHNAFIQALLPKLEHTISLRNVESR